MQPGHRVRAARPQWWRCVAAAAGIALALAAGCERAGAAAATSALLEKADSTKLRDRAEFGVLMGTIGARLRQLSADQRQYFLFLQGWNSAYDGNDAAAVAQLSRLAADSRSAVLRFRAYSTLSALFTTERRYRAAFQDLGQAQNLLPHIADGRARAEGLLDAAELYGRVGQYDLALSEAQAVIDQNWAGEGTCTGGEEKLEALFNGGRFAEFDTAVMPTIDACLKVGEPAYANEIRVELAEREIDAGRLDQARELLEKYSPQVRAIGYAPQVSAFDASLARVNEKQGHLAAAAGFATAAVRRAIPGQFPESLITGYGVLYRIAERRGDNAAALNFYRKYAAAKMGYLNDISVRELAYEQVKQEDVTRKLQVQTLSRENRVLALKHELAAKEVQATRLYGVILTLILVFIGLWAVWTKRSQLHFKSLSRVDGLTGISNRLHFIERSEATLAYARKSGQDVCLLLFDLDHFKSINDRFGHATGDFVLKRTAALCREYLRRSDIFGRFGGEEFSVLLPGCGLEEARNQAEQLRRTINAIRADERSVTVTASASFGIACSAVSGYELARLLANADAALYRAKRAGRNCAMVHDTAESGELQAIVAATNQA
ncbi:MAG TPA: GGDEF domain-containing protein [Steroidobacteraceae bacterium]|nr:GGDEF domain-containing protein [Steroidobacteraceae bacterium]